MAASFGVVVLLLAAPVPVWRTGRLPVAPLALVQNGPAIERPDRIWIDTDSACGLTRHTDPDDCLALLLLAGAEHIKIVGISSVFGNADLATTDRTARALAAKLRIDGAKIPKIWRGAPAPGVSASPAQLALQHALAQDPLTIVALGPLTTLAAALHGRPDLQAKVERVVGVMGRRPGHIFHPSEGDGDGMLWGHGPIFRDLNFDEDRDAAAEVIGMGLPLSLIPYDVARNISLTASDLDRIARSGAAGAWIASSARAWLDFWRDDIGLDGFHPFDLLAAAYVIDPERFHCADVVAWVGHDERLGNFWPFDPVALQVDLPVSSPQNAPVESRAIYCVAIEPTLHPWLMDRLAGASALNEQG